MKKAYFQIQTFDREGLIYSVADVPNDCNESKQIALQNALLEIDNYATLCGGHIETVVFYK